MVDRYVFICTVLFHSIGTRQCRTECWDWTWKGSCTMQSAQTTMCSGQSIMQTAMVQWRVLNKTEKVKDRIIWYTLHTLTDQEH